MLILLHNKFNIIYIMRFQPVSGPYSDQMVRFDPPPLLARRGAIAMTPPRTPLPPPTPSRFPKNRSHAKK